MPGYEPTTQFCGRTEAQGVRQFTDKLCAALLSVVVVRVLFTALPTESARVIKCSLLE